MKRLGLALWAVLAAGPARAQVAVRGTVVDETARRPAVGVRVDLTGGGTAWTDGTGAFELPAPPPGRLEFALRCPVRNGPSLTRTVVVDPPGGGGVELALPGGAGCLTPLSATPSVEFEGFYRVAGDGTGWFDLCGGPEYRIAASFTPEAWLAMNRLASAPAQLPPGRLPRLSIRGSLAGPGAFPPRGEADYRLRIDRVTRAALAPAGQCR